MKEVDKVYAEDFLDDGTKIALAIEINRHDGTAIFDFTGTGHEIYGNLNAPPAVTSSAVIYCLRCLLPDIDIPLNQGCLAPITIKIPQNSILNPSAKAAVVGGNVLTSQRVTDVVLKAFKACAASQGCMNNLTFGDTTMGYYETIAGGAGAGPTWHGCSGVHTHMTNTRITDVEIMERRYPVIVRTFGLRHDSGGRGKYTGGDGVIRELEFRKDLLVSILSERRAFAPYGLLGGGTGARGLNLITFHEDGRVINLGGKNTIPVDDGDRLTIYTPGGGGYGLESEKESEENENKEEGEHIQGGGLHLKTGGSLHQYVMNQESV
jgi:5-oxoprolinase (ATP-hydrolysing)